MGFRPGSSPPPLGVSVFCTPKKSFADAAEVFKELHTVLADDRFDYGERRYISAGYLRRRMVVIVWTLRGGTRHIISMRYCHAKEEARWRKHLEGLG